MNNKQLQAVIKKNRLWLDGDDAGERADLSRADLSRADLSGADLRWADLSGADLSRADLSRADLRWADLSGADLSRAIGQIYITQRSDGYQYFAVLDDGKWMIRAGRRYMSIPDYRAHAQQYDDDAKRREVNLILDFSEAMIKERCIE